VGGVTVSGLDTKPITAQAGAPRFVEVVEPLFLRWSEHFPRPGAAKADSSR